MAEVVNDNGDASQDEPPTSEECDMQAEEHTQPVRANPAIMGMLMLCLGGALACLFVLFCLTAAYWRPYNFDRPVHIRYDKGGWAAVNSILRLISSAALGIVLTLTMGAIVAKPSSLDAFSGVALIFSIVLAVVTILDCASVNRTMKAYNCGDPAVGCFPDPFIATCVFDALSLPQVWLACILMNVWNHQLEKQHKAEDSEIPLLEHEEYKRQVGLLRQARLGSVDTRWEGSLFVVLIDVPGFREGDNTFHFRVESCVPNALLQVWGRRVLREEGADGGLSERVDEFSRTIALPPTAGDFVPDQSGLRHGVARLAFSTSGLAMVGSY